MEWKLTYVGSAESSTHDQILDTIYVGPVPEGRHMFVFQADGPDHNKIPAKDILGVTAVMITCSYHGQEFVRWVTGCVDQSASSIMSLQPIGMKYLVNTACDWSGLDILFTMITNLRS